MKLFLGLVLALAVGASAAAQTQPFVYREIEDSHADTSKMLSCGIDTQRGESYVYFSESKRFAYFWEKQSGWGRATDKKATATFETVTWKDDFGGTYSLDRKTGVLNVSMQTPPIHQAFNCSEEAYFVPNTPGDTHGKWVTMYNPDSTCDKRFPTGVHSTQPIRVWVMTVEVWGWVDKDHPDGFRNTDVAQNKAATALFVQILNQESLDSRSGTSFVAAAGPRDSQLQGHLEYHFGTPRAGEPGAGHRVFSANVDIGGFGLTGPNGPGIAQTPKGYPSRIWGYWMESEYEKYDITSPGQASEIAFRKVAKGVVNGWSCGNGDWK
ncbi:MAG TPA: hypothetical protein VIK39_01745 [Candidatus Angelobacter sp.]